MWLMLADLLKASVPAQVTLGNLAGTGGWWRQLSEFDSRVLTLRYVYHNLISPALSISNRCLSWIVKDRHPLERDDDPSVFSSSSKYAALIMILRCCHVLSTMMRYFTRMMWYSTEPVAGRLEAGLIEPAVSRPSTGVYTVTLNNVSQTWPVA